LVAEISRRTFPERDVILLGDFNLNPDDSHWQMKSYQAVIQKPLYTTLSTSVRNMNTYDNIWINESTRKVFKEGF